jgi:hypothetical protein
MKLGIMQPYFLPYIGYFQLINAVDKYVIYDDVQYIVGGYINRNNFLVQGKSHLYTFPISNSTQNKQINNINININININGLQKFKKLLEYNYKKAPYFEQVFTLFNEICGYENLRLNYFIKNSLQQICNYLKISTELLMSSELNIGLGLPKNERLQTICKELGADEYINAIGGMELYDKEDFAKQGIKLSFLKTQYIEYRQFKNDFVPNLSILDVMMFNSVETVNKMLDKFELI